MPSVKIRDDLGRELIIARPPQRIVSLVPSDTYTLFALGAGERVVGRTTWCELPAAAAAIATVGGTKDVDVDAVLALEPDLIVANQEENTRPVLEALAAARARVLVSLPRRAADGVAHVARLARALGVAREPAVVELTRRGYDQLAGEPPPARLRGFVPIWMDPLMTINADTFGSDVLAWCGVGNAFGDRLRLYPLAADLGKGVAHDAAGRDQRYPRVAPGELVARAPDVILLPDEPHAFSAADREALAAIDTPAARAGRIVDVSGKDLFWYGAWTIEALPRLRAALAAIAVLVLMVACSSKSKSDQTADQPSPSQQQPEAQPPSPPQAPRPSPPHQCDPGDHVCRGDDLYACASDGTYGQRLQACKDGCKVGACVDACATHDVELVYVISSRNDLYSFDPQKLPDDPFRKVGHVGCGLVEPNSMAVDHAGIAWVVDHQHTLYRVSILDAHCSLAGSYVTDGDTELPQTFGMGFVSDGKRTATETSETLFVASDSAPDSDDFAGSMLGSLDTAHDPAFYKHVAVIQARGKWNPELSGTGEGNLFGYFPTPDKNGFVQQIDRGNGKAIGPKWKVPTEDEVEAWAFAQWGGTFYIFTTSGNNSQVHAINRKTGKYSLVREHLPMEIVGAGVSTCAPVLERG